MGSPSTLWLVGMMGSGKSSVGRVVAADLGLDYLDLDDEIVSLAGAPVEGIFSEGEERFRDLESEALERVAGSAAVVATGGGAVLRASNVERMRATGLVVWLRAEPAVLAARVGDGSGRPLLAGDPAASIERIAADRADRYREAAHLVVDTDRRDVREVAEEVERAWTGS